MHEPVV